jgi:DNA-directed RNA polymerase subunit K/omega
MEDMDELEEVLDDEIESKIESDDETDKNEDVSGDDDANVEDIEDIEDIEDVDEDNNDSDNDAIDEDNNDSEVDDDDDDVDDDMDDVDDIENIDSDDDEKEISKKSNKTNKAKSIKKTNKSIEKLYVEKDIDDYDDDDDEEDEEDENYLQKFNKEINKNYIEDIHPECVYHNYNEISALSKVIRDKNNNIIDPLHKTVPFLTKYEKTRIIGQRAKQINSGAKPFVNVPQHIIDGNIIAELELKQKKIPFIIRRPIPGGGSEYWNVKDLELI